MPELPEVEVTRRTLEPHIVGQRIAGCVLDWTKALCAPEPGAFATMIQGHTVLATRRRGKYLILDLGSGLEFVLHLRMTGGLYFTAQASPATRYTRNSFQFASGNELRFVDVRKLGQFWLAGPTVDVPVPALPEGPEPLEPGFTPAVLAQALAKRHTSLKAALLDQDTVAGLGNIYVDEALFEARLHPERAAGSLSPPEHEHLHAAIIAVLERGIANSGTSFRDFAGPTGERGANQEDLRVWHRSGSGCLRCGTVIVKTRVAGRGTHWCPACQPVKSDE